MKLSAMVEMDIRYIPHNERKLLLYINIFNVI